MLISQHISIEVKCIPTQRASTGIAALEPLEQTARVEQVLAGRTPLRWQLLRTTDDRVANGTLCLTFERAADVLPPGC